MSVLRNLYCVNKQLKQGFLGRPTWEQLVEKRSANFRNRLLTSGGDSLARMLLS